MRKRIAALLLSALFLLSGCTKSAQPPTTQSSETDAFLQYAYWYLQGSEKAIFQWEDGVLEDYCAAQTQMVICPTGERDIQGMQLRRVRYCAFRYGEFEQYVNLYFTPEGEFMGTDYNSRAASLWGGDIQMWLFPEKRELAAGETMRISVVLKNVSRYERWFSAYAPMFTELEYIQDGLAKISGINTAAQKLHLEPGAVLVEEHTAGDLSACYGTETFHEGDVLILAAVNLRESQNGTLTFQPSESAAFVLSQSAEITYTE